MNMNMENVAKAIQFIIVAHDGQFYGNMPYALHPIKVASMVENPTTTEYIAALLHDVIEDTDYTITFIRAEWGNDVADIVALLTHDVQLSYVENIQNIIQSGNKSAIKIKLADNLVNMASHKSDMTVARHHTLVSRYNTSIDMLTKYI